MTETNYQQIIVPYLNRQTTADEFIASFMTQWRQDRDQPEGVSEEEESVTAIRFHRMMNRLFTSCDCYDEEPVGPFEVMEKALRNEVELFAYVLWG